MDRRLVQQVAGWLVVGALGLGSGCSYTSQYQAPADGRPRVVWGPDNDPVVDVAGLPPPPACGAALQQVTGYQELLTTTGKVELPTGEAPQSPPLYVSGGYWVPRYYGPPIVVVTPGLAPPFFRPPLFSPSLTIASALLRSHTMGGMGSVGAGAVRSSGGAIRLGGGGSGGGGSSRLGEGALVLIALAVMVLPAIDIGLAAASPESSSKSARAIDLVNAYNDLMRSPGSACSLYATAPGIAMPSDGAVPSMPPGGSP